MHVLCWALLAPSAGAETINEQHPTQPDSSSTLQGRPAHGIHVWACICTFQVAIGWIAFDPALSKYRGSPSGRGSLAGRDSWQAHHSETPHTLLCALQDCQAGPWQVPCAKETTTSLVTVTMAYKQAMYTLRAVRVLVLVLVLCVWQYRPDRVEARRGGQ